MLGRAGQRVPARGESLGQPQPRPGPAHNLANSAPGTARVATALAGDVRAGRVGRALQSSVLPRAPGSLGPRGGAAPRGLARCLPSPVPSRGARRGLRFSRRPGKRVSVGGSGMGPPGARSVLRALSGRGRRGHVRALPPPRRTRWHPG